LLTNNAASRPPIMHETPEYKFCLVLDSARKLNANRRIAKSPMITANTVNPISMLSNLQQKTATQT